MSAVIIQFPRKREIEWDALPKHWSCVVKRCYQIAIQRGERPEDAFEEWDLLARLPEGRFFGRFKRETRESYIERLRDVVETA